jgi:hypothetical protein
MMSHWSVIPDRSSMVEPGNTGEFTHSVEMELVSWVEGDTEERVAQMTVDDGLQLAAHLADMQRLVPIGHGREVRRDEAFDVVLCSVGQLRRILHQEAGAAVERPPDTERDRERVAPFDRPVARAEQPVPRPRPGAEHEMAGQWRAVPPQQLHAVPLGHPGPHAGQHVAHAGRRLARGPLERRQLLDLVDHPEPVGWIDEQVVRVLHQARGAGGQPQLVDEEGRNLDRLAARVRLPADDPDPAGRPDALVGQDLGQRPRAVSRLAGQAEVLEANWSHRQRCRLTQAIALVAEKDRRFARRSDDEHRLFEPWVEPGEVGDVRAVLPIAHTTMWS